MGSIGSIGFVGIGRMGGGLINRILKAGGQVFAFDRDPTQSAKFSGDFIFVDSLSGLTKALPNPRIIWLMVPAGDPVDQCINEILPSLSPGDIVIDGGNSNFHDTVRRYNLCKSQNISYMDVGTSGGVWGEKNGFCMMIGGDQDSFKSVEPFLRSCAAMKVIHIWVFQVRVIMLR